MQEHDEELDLSGLNCPLPIIKTKQAVAKLDSGKVLKVTGTDPGSPKEFKMFDRQPDTELLSMEQDGNTTVYFIKKK
ncbi:MAG: sulfurtransferase TusA family protein [Gammaproteobacteria bacterium]